MLWNKKCVIYVGQFDGLESVTGTEGRIIKNSSFALMREKMSLFAIQVQITPVAA